MCLPSIDCCLSTELINGKSNMVADSGKYFRFIAGETTYHKIDFVNILLWSQEATLKESQVSISQWRSQNAEKVTHTKGRILDKTMILFNWNGNFS